MAGVVLETLSNTRLIIFGLAALLIQVGFFLLGGLKAPSPSNVQQLLATNCLMTAATMYKYDADHWYYSRGKGACEHIEFSEKRIETEHIMANHIVFAVQFPMPRENIDLTMSRLFQNIIAVAHFHVVFREHFQYKEDVSITLDTKLGYRNKEDEDHDWKLIAESLEERQLKCIVKKKLDNEPVDCDMFPLFELGSVHHDFYLLNIRLPTSAHANVSMNEDLMEVKELWVYAIHQNGGFTLVWMSMKSVVFPLVLGCLIWYCWRLRSFSRKPNLLERSLIALGCAMSLLNLPIDWLTLWVDMPWMTLVTDIRQGIFYSVLMCFWLIFAGEHLMDSVARNNLMFYWKHLAAVAFGCICLFIFEMCERGVQLTNPFYSVWGTTPGSTLAHSFIILAGVAACVYFLFLLYMIIRVFRNISAKKSSLPQMSKPRQKFYMGIIYRFNFLMASTLICAAMTVAFFIVGQVSEGEWKWGERRLEYTSAFLTGVYGMWNIYVFSLLALYCPSTKYDRIPEQESNITLQPMSRDHDTDSGEQVEFSKLPAETSALTHLTSKAAED